MIAREMINRVSRFGFGRLANLQLFLPQHLNVPEIIKQLAYPPGPTVARSIVPPMLATTGVYLLLVVPSPSVPP